MDKHKYNVLSPDGFNISIYNFPTEEKAIAYLQEWVKRFEAQGYYSTGNRERIPYEDIIDSCTVIKHTL